jgi:hypothetical protein
MRTTIAALTVASLLITPIVGFALAPSAQSTPTEVNVRIEGKTRTLFEGPVMTEGHEVEASSDTQPRSCDGIDVNDPENVEPGPTPTAASADALAIVGETFDGEWYPGYEDYFITRWGPDKENTAEGAYWGILVNNVFTNIGGCQYELSKGDEVLWVYNAFAARPFLALYNAASGCTDGPRPLTATAQLDVPFAVEVTVYGDQAEDVPPASPECAGAVPYQGARVAPVQTAANGFETVQEDGAVQTNAAGKASITFTEPGWHRIKASAGNAVRSNRLDVCVPAAGETGCGEPPAEDLPRTPPSLAEELAHAHEHPKSSAGEETEGAPVQEEKRSEPGSGATDNPQPPVSGGGGGLVTTTDQTAGGPLASVAVASVSPARLLLKLTVPGQATVEIAHKLDKRHHGRWQIVKTLEVQATKAGQVEVKLPRLPAGSYRVSVNLAGANSVVKTLTVPRARTRR